MSIGRFCRGREAAIVFERLYASSQQPALIDVNDIGRVEGSQASNARTEAFNISSHKADVAVIVTFAIIIAVIAFFIGSYNHLQSMDENVDSSWAQVENQLQRRYDLIPNLAAVVKSYSEYEAQTLTDIVAMRTSGTVEGEKKADEAYTTYVNALTENYPELKADTEYQSLMTELAGTENRIAVARRDYNNAVQTLNGAIRRFPGSLIASMSGVEKREYFEVSTAAQENVDVSKLLSNDN